MIINKKAKGFGVIEVLVASTTIAVILSALVMAGNIALRNTIRLGQRIQATYLAQEGLEIVRQIRDTNWIDEDNSTDWNSFIWDESGNLIKAEENYQGCVIATGNRDQERFGLSCDSDRQDSIILNNTTFRRTVSIQEVGDSLLPGEDGELQQSYNSLKITVKVTWDQDGEIILSQILTNWRPKY